MGSANGREVPFGGLGAARAVVRVHEGNRRATRCSLPSDTGGWVPVKRKAASYGTTVPSGSFKPFRPTSCKKFRSGVTGGFAREIAGVANAAIRGLCEGRRPKRQVWHGGCITFSRQETTAGGGQNTGSPILARISHTIPPDGLGPPPGRPHHPALRTAQIPNGRRLSEPAGPSRFSNPSKPHNRNPPHPWPNPHERPNRSPFGHETAAARPARSSLPSITPIPEPDANLGAIAPRGLSGTNEPNAGLGVGKDCLAASRGSAPLSRRRRQS